MVPVQSTAEEETVRVRAKVRVRKVVVMAERPT